VGTVLHVGSDEVVAYRFGDDWADEIAEVTTDREYQNIDVRIIDPVALTAENYNVDTGQWTTPAEYLVYEGQARIIGVRWGVESGGQSQANALTLSSVRLQISGPEAWERMRKNQKVFITASPKNPALLSLIFTVTSDLQGGMPASRTLQMALDGDVVIPNA
jgi:hypothetical protein